MRKYLFLIFVVFCLGLGKPAVTMFGPFMKGLTTTTNYKIASPQSAIKSINFILDKNGDLIGRPGFNLKLVSDSSETGLIQGLFHYIDKSDKEFYLWVVNSHLYYLDVGNQVVGRVKYIAPVNVWETADSIKGTLAVNTFAEAFPTRTREGYELRGSWVTSEADSVDTLIVDFTRAGKILYLTTDTDFTTPSSTTGEVHFWPKFHSIERVYFYEISDTLIITDGHNPAIVWWGDVNDYLFYGVMGYGAALVDDVDSLLIFRYASGEAVDMADDEFIGCYAQTIGGTVTDGFVGNSSTFLLIVDNNYNSIEVSKPIGNQFEWKDVALVSGIGEILIDTGTITTSHLDSLIDSNANFSTKKSNYYTGEYVKVLTGDAAGTLVLVSPEVTRNTNRLLVHAIVGDTLLAECKYARFRFTYPIFKHLKLHNDQIFISNQDSVADRTIWWSDPLSNCRYYNASYLDVDAYGSGEINGLASLYGNLYIFTNQDIWGFNGPDYLGNFSLSKVIANIGCDVPSSIIEVNNQVIAIHNKNLYLFNGNNFSLISGPVSLLLDSINTNYSHRIRMINYDNRLIVSYPVNDTVNDRTLYFDPSFNYWSQWNVSFTEITIESDVFLKEFYFSSGIASEIYYIADSISSDTSNNLFLAYQTPYIDFGEPWSHKKWWKGIVDYHKDSNTDDTLFVYLFKNRSVIPFDTLAFPDSGNVFLHQSINGEGGGRNISAEFQLNSQAQFRLNDFGYRWVLWGSR